MPRSDAEQPLIDDLNAVQGIAWGDFLKPFVFLGWAAFGMVRGIFDQCVVRPSLLVWCHHTTASQAAQLRTLATFKRYV